MKLNGWQRLWVLVSGIYLGLVVVYTILSLPSPPNIQHSDCFYDQLQPELKNKISWTRQPKEFHIEEPIRPEDPRKLQEEWDKAVPLYSVKMPNEHVIYFKSTLPEKEIQEVAEAYWRIVKKEADQRRLHRMLTALLLWAGVVIMIYAIGWLVGWVHKGFKKQ